MGVSRGEFSKCGVSGGSVEVGVGGAGGNRSTVQKGLRGQGAEARKRGVGFLGNLPLPSAQGYGSCSMEQLVSVGAQLPLMDGNQFS